MKNTKQPNPRRQNGLFRGAHRPKHMKRLLILACLLTAQLLYAGAQTVDLSGEWRFALDPENKGIAGKWFGNDLAENIQLPGSLQAQGFGEKPTINGPWTARIGMNIWRKNEAFEAYRSAENLKSPVFLMPARLYVGAAWYQREIEIPANLKDQRIKLFLERPHWKTTVWIDQKEVGSLRMLGSPHTYELDTFVTPGKHTLTIRVDNTVNPNVGADAHSVSDQTQTNWNGIIGRIELSAAPQYGIEQLRTYPNTADKNVRIEFDMSSPSGRGTVTVAAVGIGDNTHQAPSKSFDVTWTDHRCEILYPMGDEAQLWDEHTPNLYKLGVAVEDKTHGDIDRHISTLGLKNLAIDGTQFTVNGKAIQLRGTLDCAISPLTGYPPTDVDSWLKIMRTSKDFGLNHIRFHSWCPPEAAFQAADQVGIYLQVEAGVWSHNVGGDKALQDWVMTEETPGIIASYGNHPSMLFVGIGNEGSPRDREAFSRGFVNHFRAQDNRFAYTAFAAFGIEDTADFLVKHKIGRNTVTRGLGDTEKTRGVDYSNVVAAYDLPIITHENVQESVYPDFEEMARYTGFLKPKNYEIFRDKIHENGMGAFEEDLFISTGKLQTLHYKSQIEALLRTSKWAGYQLLGLNDFSGQGTALVGPVNVFWESKRYTSAEEYRRFQGPVVPLALFDKRVLTTNETLDVVLQVAQYGAQDLLNQSVVWTLTSSDGQTIDSGKTVENLPRGGLHDAGHIQANLAAIKAPEKLTLTVSLEGTSYTNDWDFWIYPTPQLEQAPNNVIVAQDLDDKTLAALHRGATVCLLANPDKINAADGAFAWKPIFWNRITFPQQSYCGKGLWIDKAHPALAQFPTNFFSQWQWADMMDTCAPINLSQIFPQDQRGIVMFNDSWDRGRKLGVLFEAQVGKGKLLLSTFDLNTDITKRPAAAQLRKSLLAYAASPEFKPTLNLPLEDLQEMFKAKRTNKLRYIGGRVLSATSEQREPNYTKELATDGSPDTIWHSQYQPRKPLPQSLVLQLPKILQLEGLLYLPRQDNRPGRITHYEIRLSDDGETWSEPVLSGKLSPKTSSLQELRFKKPTEAAYVQFTALAGHADVAAIAEIDIIFDVDEAIQQGEIDPTGFLIGK